MSKRLLVIEPGLKLWGSERAFLATVPAFVETYDEVVIMVPPGAELSGELRRHPVTLIEAPIGNLHQSGRAARLRAAAAILLACKRHRIDKIYLNQAGLCRIVHRIAGLLGVELVIHVRLIEDIERCANLPLSPPIELIHISHDMRRRHPAQREQGKRLVTVYDPFELSEPGERAEPTQAICCVGRISEGKGQLRLVEGLEAAIAAGVPADIDFIGAGVPGSHDESAVRTRAARMARAGHVRFLGYRIDAPALMSRYRFVAIPSRYEPLGRVVMEAWDAGALPICSRDAGGCSEIVSASGAGVLYSGHDPDAIGLALAKAISMAEDERLALVERGRAWVRQNLSLAAYRDALTGVLFSPASPAGKTALQGQGHR